MRKQTKSQIFKTVCRFQGCPDVAGMALIENEGINAMIAAGNWLLSKADALRKEAEDIS